MDLRTSGISNPSTYARHRIVVWKMTQLVYIPTLLYSQHFLNYYYFLEFCVIALNFSGWTLYTLTEQTDTSSHSRLFVDGRLAGSSCLVGCAGVGPPRTSWQPCLRQPCACRLSSGMIHVEQKHHSTQSLDPRPGAICKTLRSNTRASYDPQLGGYPLERNSGTYQRWY